MLTSPAFVVLLAYHAGLASVALAPDAPFRVVKAAGREVQVDIGVMATRSEGLRAATVLTPRGAVSAILVRLESVCEEVCGNDEADRECHFEAVVRSSSRRVDDAMGVLAGARAIRNLTRIEAGDDGPVGSPERWLTAEPVEDGDLRYRWGRFPDGVYLTSSYEGQDYGRAFYSPAILLSECRVRSAAPFTMLACPSAELLYDGARGVAASFADYGEQSARPLLRFQVEGREAVLIRLGLKAEMTEALLVKQPEGTWRLHVRHADYALLC